MRYSRADRALTLAVVIVWLTAACLGAAYLLQRHLGTDELVAATAVASDAGNPVDVTETQAALTVAGGGDVLGDRKVGAFIDAKGGAAVFAGVAPLFSSADVAIVNLESPLSDVGAPKAGKDVVFRGRPRLVEGLAAAGIDVAGLANNHALDYGPEALSDTIGRLTDAGLHAVGAGSSLEEAARPATLTVEGSTISVLAYSHILPEGFPAAPGRAGVNPSRPDTERLLGDIRSAAGRSDWVVVSMHWGVEYAFHPTQDQRELARRMVDAGADLILGHHPHVIQGIEVYRGALIAYSLGGLVFDHYSRETGESVVLTATLRKGQSPSAELTPIYLSDSNGVPEIVTGEAADRILGRMVELSKALGTDLVRDADRAQLM